MNHCISQPVTESTLFSVSLGMVVIDEIRFPSRAPIIDVAGGSAVYGTRTQSCLSTTLDVLIN